jgi:hypothetical protein
MMSGPTLSRSSTATHGSFPRQSAYSPSRWCPATGLADGSATTGRPRGGVPVLLIIDPADRICTLLTDPKDGEYPVRRIILAALHLAQREAGLAAISQAQRHHRIRGQHASRPDASHGS